MKTQKLKFTFLVFIFSFSNLFSQYTDIINSNNPGFSESPYSVGSGVYQFESSFFLKNLSTNTPTSLDNSWGVDLAFRTSFFLERLEFDAALTFQRDRLLGNFTNAYTINSGLSKIMVGAKYLIFESTYKDKSKEIRSWKRRFAFDTKRLIPSIAVFAGVNTDFVSDVYKTNTVSPRIGILLQNELSNYFNVITNFFYDFIGTNFSEYQLTITGTYNFNDRWSWFLENQTIFQQNQTNTSFAGGLAFLFNKDLQINTSARFLREAGNNGSYITLGLSYRINRHVDSYKLLDENGNEIIDTPINRYNNKRKGFFNRIFSIFKKKNKGNKTRNRGKRKRNN